MSKDPYKYFRIEARELIEGLSAGVLELEKGAASPESIARLLRLAHTLKGAARVVKQATIAEAAHQIEDVLGPHRGGTQTLGDQQIAVLLARLDGMSAQLKTLGEASVPQAAAVEHAQAKAAPVDETLDTVRIDIHEMDQLLRGVSDTAVQLGALRRDLVSADGLRDLARVLADQLAARPGDSAAVVAASTQRARSLAEELGGELERLVRKLASSTERVAAGIEDAHELAQRMRLLPAQTVFGGLERAVRDAAQALGVQVDFEASGGDVRLDAQVLAELRDALMHVVRNAVTHGIEPAATRTAAGKVPRGTVKLGVARRAGRVVFSCHDDGRGVDLDAVREAAVSQGALDERAARGLDARQLLSLLRKGGLSTSTRVTELSGRGIGLDVVRATVTKLKGEVAIASERGRGTTVELQVPVSIASFQGLIVESTGAAAAIPLDAVRRTLRLRSEDIASSAHSQSIVHEGQVIPFVPLDHALRRATPGGQRRRAWSAVVVAAGERGVAVGVDRLLGTANVVMRALPSVVQADAVIAGACLDADGNPQLVLDPNGLFAIAERGVAPTRDSARAPRAPILVIDDSLTTRMLEQSILQSAGYEVELAVSAEDGLEKARARPHALFIVDVEMPGMNGFEFVASTRADATLRATPAILVTSRNEPEDLRRGAQVGASAYIVKGEFDQGQLLSTIRRLVG